MAKCEVCGKGPSFGRSIQHQGGGGWFRRAPKTNRVFKPNIQKATLVIDGTPVQLKLCTRCLRTAQKTR
ncbi:MAG TPA: 50S ribosomal protein L28 [Roseiflexaceae bacterium]|jgi:large subunit ribosomal protein L28|nr:50S ribosomal protein L28 [Roseiflexaceae bacterium]